MTISLDDEEREWMLQWRQAAHPFGLSDHPEAMSTTAVSKIKTAGAEDETFRRVPPSGAVKEINQAGGLPSLRNCQNGLSNGRTYFEVS